MDEGTQEDGARPAPVPPVQGWGPMRTFPRALVLVFSIDCVAALVPGVITGGYLTSFVYSQCTGLSGLVAAWALHHRCPRMQPARSALAILVGATVGLVLARTWQVGTVAGALREPHRLLVPAALSTLLMAGVFSWIYLRSALFEERARRAEQERQLAEASLKLLQAQIEPHFLFNTLSNVVQLVEGDPPGARRMLLDLTSYLRGSLARTREGTTTVADELELVQAYLGIQSVRMGERLRWRIECPEATRALPLPPLLVQPLVENAIRHGIDPLPEGGEVVLVLAREPGALRIEVTDSGLGLAAPSASGVGLANVRARVLGSSSGRGSMVIQPRAPRGLSVRITLPVEGGSET